MASIDPPASSSIEPPLPPPVPPTAARNQQQVEADDRRRSSSGGDGGAGQQQQPGSAAKDGGKEKQKEACVACRTTKVKCHAVSADSAPHDPCKRCVRLSLECLYQQKKRGRKVGSGQKRKSEAVDGSPAGASLKRKASTSGVGKKRAREPTPDDSDDDDAPSPSLLSASSESEADDPGAAEGSTSKGFASTNKGEGHGASRRRRSSYAPATSAAGTEGSLAPASTLPSFTLPAEASRAHSSDGWRPVSGAAAASSLANFPPPRDAWGTFLPPPQQQSTTTAVGPGGGQYNDLGGAGFANGHSPISGGGLTPSYASGSAGGGGDALPRYPTFPQHHLPPGSHLGHPNAHVPLSTMLGTQSQHAQQQQQQQQAPLYIAHIQPSWSDQRSILNRGVVRSGGGDQDPYGFPSSSSLQQMGPPSLQHHLSASSAPGGGSGFQPSHSRNDGFASASAPPLASVPSSSVGSDHQPISRPSPTASVGGPGGPPSLPDTPSGNTTTSGLRHLLNHPSPSSTTSQSGAHSVVGLTQRRPSSTGAESGRNAVGSGGSGPGGNRVTSGAITGTIPMSVKEVLTGHIGPLGGDGGGGGGESENWQAKKRRGIDGMLRASIDWDTPLEMRILSEEDVFELFDFFHTKLNVFVDLLDVALHTPLFVRRTSAILFTTILSIASRFRRPSLYIHLHKMVNNMLGRAFAEGIVEVGLVQSLSLLAFWKEADDRGTWRRVGYAIRLALEMDLHHPNHRPLPEDEEEARKLLDRERTFIQLIAFDNTLYLQSSRPKMIPPDYTRHVSRWASDHPQYFCLSDAMLSASIENQTIFAIVGACRASDDRLLKGQLFDSADGMVRAWKEIWLGDAPRSQLHPSCRIMLTFYCLLTEFEMRLLRQSLSATGVEAEEEPSTSPDEIIAFSEAVGAALKVLRYMVTDLKEFLPHSQDTVIFGSASTASWLAKNLFRMHHTARHESLLAIHGAMSLYKSISHGEDAFNYQAQFLRSLLLVSNRTVTEQSSMPQQQAPAMPLAGANYDQSHDNGGGGSSHLQPPIDVNQPPPPPSAVAATPGYNGGIVDLSPSAMDSNLVAPDASIEDILQMYADVFPFCDPNAGSSFDGTQTPNFSTAFVGSSFPTF